MLSFGQNSLSSDTISLVFIGDIMGHNPQITSAFNASSGKYIYKDVLNKISHITKNTDFAIANLEVTLAGKPYRGYPQFSSPDALVVECKENGINVLITANNHSSDRGKKGIIRTLNKLDSLSIKHTGTFRDSLDRDTNNLIILTKGNIKLGLLNYTYGINGLPFPSPTIVNLIDTIVLTNDIKMSQEKNIDKLIVMFHWGKEYESQISQEQIELSDFLIKKGVDIIIGSHPHVLQRMEHFPKTDTTTELFIAYSLGNFVSNQRTRKRDGGAMLKITLTKTNNKTNISNKGYYLTWVHKYKKDGKSKYEILPCLEYERNGFYNLDDESISKMKLFLHDSRALLQQKNININEIKYQSTPRQSQRGR